MKKRNIPIETWLSAILAALIFIPTMETTVTMEFMGQVGSSSTTVTLYNYMTTIFKNAVNTDNVSFNEFISSYGAALIVCWLLLNAVLQALRKHISIITIIISFSLAMFCFAGIDANNNEIDGNMLALVKMQHKPQIGLFLNIGASAVLFISSLITMFVDMWRGSRWLYYKIRGIEPPQKAIATDETEEKAPLMTEKSKEENNVSTERNTIKEKDPNSDETTESSNRKKWGYTLGGIIAIVLIGIICFFTFGKGKKSESILGLQKPKWEKFVHMTGKETAFYKSPDTSSPRLMQACNAEGCGVDYQYLWTGEKPSEGYTNFENYKYADETSVFPVIEEQDGWYKVYLSTKDKIHEAYVEKSQCEEVTPETITQEALSKISSDYYLLEQGKYKNLCFALGSNDIGESELCMGELIDEKCIAFSSHYDMFILENDTTPNFTFSRDENISDDGATDYIFRIFFNPNRTISTGDYKHFNTKSLTEEEISNIVEKTTSVKHDNGLLRYAYYFPSVSGNSLFYFYPYKGNSVSEATIEETPTIDYKAIAREILKPLTTKGYAPVKGRTDAAGVFAALGMSAERVRELSEPHNLRGVFLDDYEAGDISVSVSLQFDGNIVKMKTHKEIVEDGWSSVEKEVEDGYGWNDKAKLDRIILFFSTDYSELRDADFTQVFSEVLVEKGFTIEERGHLKGSHEGYVALTSDAAEKPFIVYLYDTDNAKNIRIDLDWDGTPDSDHIADDFD